MCLAKLVQKKVTAWRKEDSFFKLLLVCHKSREAPYISSRTALLRFIVWGLWLMSDIRMPALLSSTCFKKHCACLSLLKSQHDLCCSALSRRPPWWDVPLTACCQRISLQANSLFKIPDRNVFWKVSFCKCLSFAPILKPPGNWITFPWMSLVGVLVPE